MPARLLGSRERTGGAMEVLLLKRALPESVGDPGEARQEGQTRRTDRLRRRPPGGHCCGSHRFRREGAGLPVRGRVRKPAGAARPDAPAPVHPRTAGRARAVPDRVRPGVGALRPPRRRGCTSRPSCWTGSPGWGWRCTRSPCTWAWHLPARGGGGPHKHKMHSEFYHVSPEAAAAIERGAGPGRGGGGGGHHHGPHAGDRGRRARHASPRRGLDGDLHLSRLPLPSWWTSC